MTLHKWISRSLRSYVQKPQHFGNGLIGLSTLPMVVCPCRTQVRPKWKDHCIAIGHGARPCGRGLCRPLVGPPLRPERDLVTVQPYSTIVKSVN